LKYPKRYNPTASGLGSPLIFSDAQGTAFKNLIASLADIFPIFSVRIFPIPRRMTNGGKTLPFGRAVLMSPISAAWLG